LIGAVPYRALEIPVDATIDAHKNRLTYAVTLTSTDPATYIDNPADPALHSGGIDVVDSGGNTLLSVAETAHAFFFSHGADGKGSFTDGGILNAASDCTTGVDAGNCDGDASFVAAMQSYGTEDAYYDDVSTYTLLAEGTEDKLWARSPVSTANIYNINSNNVGIGTSDPQRVLHVAGDTLVEGSLIAENFVQTGEGDVSCSSENAGAIRLRSGAALEYCAGGSWRPLVHDGENVTCSGNRAIKSFDENGNPECGTVGSAVINIPSCPSGVLVGVSNGQPICVDVSTTGPSTPQPLPPDPLPPEPVPPTSDLSCASGLLFQGIDASGNAICKSLDEMFTAVVVRAGFGNGNSGAMWVARCPEGTVRLGCSLINDVRPTNDVSGVQPLAENGCLGSSSNTDGANAIYAICLKVRD
jgi:hypothetical protein